MRPLEHGWRNNVTVKRIQKKMVRICTVKSLVKLSCCDIIYYTILYYTIIYYNILYYTILYYTILYYTILYYNILYYNILYYTILYYTILYYTILYYTILYYTILSQVVPRLAKNWHKNLCLINSEGLNLSDPEHVNVAQIGEAGNGDFTIHLLVLKHDGTQNSNKKAVPSFFLNSLPTLTPCQKGRTWEPA